MKPGPRPKPTLLRKFEGNPGKRPLTESEPKPRSAKRLPAAPSYLNVDGKKEWKRAGTELHRLGLLTKLDVTAFAAYCQAYSVFINAVRNLEKHGMLVKAQSGFPVQSPYLSIVSTQTKQMIKLQTEFGMTPSSRSRIEVGRDTIKKPRGQELLT